MNVMSYKKGSIAILLAVLISAFPAAAKGKKKTLKGYLVDVSCATERTRELPTLGVVHTKECLQMPACVRSGYALLTTDQKIIRFDAAGNDQATKLIASADRKSDFRIRVRGRVDADQIAVSELQLLP
jgi:hypothetical protein